MVRLEQLVLLLVVMMHTPILQPKTGAATTIQMLTPGGATIFESAGTSDITAEFGASIDIGNSGAETKSTLQTNSNIWY